MAKKTKNAAAAANKSMTERRFMIGPKMNFASAEAYKLLRTNVMFSFPDATEHHILGVTSSFRGEGKSLTSINLAYTFAETGMNILLIEGDMRLPTMSFDVLVSGDIPPNPSELLGSARTSAFLKKARERYDYILLDLPPVTAVTDAIIASHLVDGMIVVVRANHAVRGGVADTMRQLSLADAHVLGFVFNGAKNSDSRYYKKGYYKKDYYYSNYYKSDSSR